MQQTRLVPRWFLAATVLIVLMPALTLVVNHSAVQPLILNRLKVDTGIEVAAARLHVFPRLTVEFWEMAVRERRDGPAVFRSRYGSLTVRWLPLFKRRLAIVKAVLEEPHLVIVQQASGEWRIPLTSATQPPSGPGAFTWDRLLPDLQINRGTVHLVDEAERARSPTAAITDVTTTIETDLFRTEADVMTTAQVGNAGRLEVFGLLALARAAIGSSPVDRTPHAQFEGSLRLSRFDLLPWLTGRSPADFASGERPNPIDLSAQTVIQWGPAGYDATVSRIEAGLGWVVLRGQAAVRRQGAEPVSYAVTCSSSPVGLHALLRHIPAGWVPPQIRSSVDEHELAGTLELVSATVRGRADSLGEVDWNGVAKFSEGRGVFGPERIPLQNLSGTIFFDPLYVEAMNLSGRVADVAVADGGFVLSHLDLTPILDLRISGTGRTETLLPLIQTFGGAGMETLQDLKGEVQFGVHVAGPLAPDRHIRLVKAELKGHDLGGRLAGRNLAVEQVEGTVEVTPGFVELKQVRGRIGPIVFDVQGPVERGSPPRLDDVTVNLSSDGAALAAFLVERLSVSTSLSGFSFDGPVQASIRLAGPPQDLRWNGYVDLGQAEVRLPPVVEKRRGVAAAVEFEGRIAERTRVSVRRFAVRLPSVLVESRADIRLGAEPRFTASVGMEPTALAGLADAASGMQATDGLLRASFSLRGRGLNWRRWTGSGWIELKHGGLMVEGLRDPLRALSFRLLLDGRHAMIERLACKVGESDIRVRGIVEEWLRAPTARLTLESSKLDLTGLLRAEGGVEREGRALERIRRWTESGRADVTMMIGQAHYHRLTFRALSGRLVAGEGKLELQRLVGETPNGLLKGQLQADISPAGAMDLHGELDVSGVPIHHLTALIDPDADPVRGLLAVKGALAATVGGDSSPVRTLRTLDPLRLRIDQGRVIHGTVLPKVLKILNLPALLKERVDLDRGGIPFDRVSATVTAENGLLRSDNIVFDSPIVKISGAGTLDMAADDLDLALAVSPLGAYADLVGKIPLFGTLFAGDRPGLSTALFEVKGPRRDPDIRYLPVESIAKGLTGYPRLAIDVLINTVTLPQKLLESAGQ